MAEIAVLDDADSRGAVGRKTVELDQQSIGRLSRMDALQQQQAMAKADGVRRAGARRRLVAALDRIETGDYGFCGDCGEPIAEKRLEIDPAITLCVSCARG